jgi:hypothetical protein
MIRTKQIHAQTDRVFLKGWLAGFWIRSRPRWCQFSLRTLLIIVTLSAFACSWLAVQLRRAERQHKAVAAIAELGGTITYDSVSATPWIRNAISSLLEIDFCCTVTNATFVQVGATGPRVAALCELVELRGLQMAVDRLTPEDVAKLNSIKTLKTIKLKQTDCEPEVIDNLANLWRLDELHVTSSRNPDYNHMREVFSHLGGLKQIQYLQFEDNISSEIFYKLLRDVPACHIIQPGAPEKRTWP